MDFLKVIKGNENLRLGEILLIKYQENFRINTGILKLNFKFTGLIFDICMIESLKMSYLSRF
jgi:hypothetical protein